MKQEAKNRMHRSRTLLLLSCVDDMQLTNANARGTISRVHNDRNYREDPMKRYIGAFDKVRYSRHSKLLLGVPHSTEN